MLFRARLFTVLAALCILWSICGTGYACTITASTVAKPTLEPGKTQVSDAYVAGAGIGGSLVAAVFLCSGIPLLIIFALLAWRNRVGLRTEKFQSELVQATRGEQPRSDTVRPPDL